MCSGVVWDEGHMESMLLYSILDVSAHTYQVTCLTISAPMFIVFHVDKGINLTNDQLIWGHLA